MDVQKTDVQKIGRLRPGGGWASTAATAFDATTPASNYNAATQYVHSPIGDGTRLAYAGTHAGEKALTCVGFVRAPCRSPVRRPRHHQ